MFFIFAFSFENKKNISIDSDSEWMSEEIIDFNHKGNQTLNSFSKAKTIAREMYKGMQNTFYCNCEFNNWIVDHQSCGFIPIKESTRSYKIEWEHIVPAYNLGKTYPEWRYGHKDCVHMNNKKYRGRKCLSKVSESFRLMEADLYNLVPVIGEVNQQRSNLPMGIVKSQIYKFGDCATKLSNSYIEPRNKVKGFIARTYKYMHHSYPSHKIITKKNKKLMDDWDKSYPPDKHEKTRAKRIYLIQGNKNIFI